MALSSFLISEQFLDFVSPMGMHFEYEGTPTSVAHQISGHTNDYFLQIFRLHNRSVNRDVKELKYMFAIPGSKADLAFISGKEQLIDSSRSAPG